MDCSEGIVSFDNITGGENMEEMRRFMEKFILFHLGRDAGVRVETGPSGNWSFHISHPRIWDIRFELGQECIERYSRDLPAFEELLLEKLTACRKGLTGSPGQTD